MSGKLFVVGALADARFESWRTAVLQLLAAAGAADLLPADPELLALYERGVSAREAAALVLAELCLTTWAPAGEGA
jgi:hypothetical protein